MAKTTASKMKSTESTKKEGKQINAAEKSKVTKSAKTTKTTESTKKEKKSVKKTELPAKVTAKKKAALKNIEPQILMPTVNEDLAENKNIEQTNTTPIRYSDEDLEVFRSVIEMNRLEALDELRMLEERITDLNQSDINENMVYSDHMGEQGSEAMEKEKAYAQRQRITEYIQKLNEAMARIEDKTYGICRMCNCLIAKERLLAVPITTLSASWKIHQKYPADGIDRIESINKNKK